MTKEIELIENHNLRMEYIDRVEVLDRVGKLHLLPKSIVATTSMVADFYKVPQQAIYSLVHDHKGEIVSDGYRTVKSKDLVNRMDTPSSEEGVSIERVKGGYVINGIHKLSYSSVGVFPKRAILRIGMLLRDSEVAKEVRTLLLNKYEDKPFYTPPVRTYTEEDAMLLDIVNGSTKEDRALALGSYKHFKDGQLTSMENHLTLVENQFGALVKNLGKLVDANKDNLMLLERK